MLRVSDPATFRTPDFAPCVTPVTFIPDTVIATLDCGVFVTRTCTLRRDMKGRDRLRQDQTVLEAFQGRPPGALTPPGCRGLGKARGRREAGRSHSWDYSVVRAGPRHHRGGRMAKWCPGGKARHLKHGSQPKRVSPLPGCLHPTCHRPSGEFDSSAGVAPHKHRVAQMRRRSSPRSTCCPGRGLGAARTQAFDRARRNSDALSFNQHLRPGRQRIDRRRLMGNGFSAYWAHS